MLAVGQEPRQVALGGPSRLDDGLEPRVRCPEVPAVEELVG